MVTHMSVKLRERPVVRKAMRTGVPQRLLPLAFQLCAALLGWLGAGAPLLASDGVPAQEETLAQAARWAAERRINHFAGLALAVSGQENDHLNVALATPDGTFALRVKFSVTRHSLAVRQEVCAMMALNMLRRWLNGQPLASEHGWINVVDSLSL